MFLHLLSFPFLLKGPLFDRRRLSRRDPLGFDLVQPLEPLAEAFERFLLISVL